MKKMLETLGLVINGGSIALYFYLASVLEVSNASIATNILAWMAFVLGFALIALSSVSLLRNRGRGLIDGGIFGIVRHPMYVGAMLLFLSWIFFLPHWIIVLISAINIAIIYAFILQGERFNITKFGDAYSRYMERVPRLDLFTGMIRYLRRK